MRSWEDQGNSLLVLVLWHTYTPEISIAKVLQCEAYDREKLSANVSLKAESLCKPTGFLYLLFWNGIRRRLSVSSREGFSFVDAK